MLSQIFDRLKKYWRRRAATSLALAGGALLSGCAPVAFDPSRPPVTISEVVQLTKAAVPAEIIVNRMHASKTIYRLNAAQLAQLHDQGVADPVLNYMQETYLDAVRQEQDRADAATWELWRNQLW